MKFLPKKYRESQTDWFAKRGISWHISVVARKNGDEVQTQTFVHIARNCNQDASAVVHIVEHVLRTIKSECPEIKKAFLRQDNAGCYHSAATLAAYADMEKRTGIRVERADFSDPQGGKGPCDRKAAHIKAHVRKYINEGHDVTTLEQLKNAMLSYGGLQGVRIALVDASLIKQSLSAKWEGISFLNNFEYQGSVINSWRAFDVGRGKGFPVDDMQGGHRFLYLFK
ncbi:uncharacterized protein LOC125572200 [Nematostella vectensis]|uniref:uncharacterized protein LOC125572200 n=1 Tax=Nematostella vectensis TaxID=45351 RepID=UPI0020771F3E|nr:uncharacterized protein LOC125572200 [Nematostella vectensis]